MHHTILVGIITFIVFFIEAMLHYNIGRNSGKEGFLIKWPKTLDLIKIIIVLGVFSFTNGCIITFVKNYDH